MNTSRKLRLQSIVLLLTMLMQIAHPTVAYALADGPEQPEFASYEDFDATDMVNLATGDFTYNIPLLNVPSPEGGFQIPLSYHAGIQLNEEASWVGLGWSFNSGAIARQVSCYPDDYSGQQVSTSVTNPGISGYVRTVYDGMEYRYYDSNKGWGGTGSFLFFTVDNEGEIGISAFGLTFKDGEAAFDASKMMEQTVSMAFSAAAGATGGMVGSALYSAARLKESSLGQEKTGSSFDGKWTLEYSNYNSDFLGARTSYNYKYFLKFNATNSHYGTLYLGEMGYNNDASIYLKVCNNNNGANASDGISNRARWYCGNTNNPAIAPSSDMFIQYTDNYAREYNPTSLAYDNYSVMGKGVGGIIKPYREDFGSLSNPIFSDDMHNCYVGPRFLSRSDYKVQFKYEGDFTNSYTHHNTSTNLDKKPFPVWVDDTQNASYEHMMVATIQDDKAYVDYTACGGCSPAFQQYNPYYTLAAKTEGDRVGRYQNKLAHKKHIEWYTNNDIYTGLATTKGFIDTHQGYDRMYNASTGRYITAEGIGGFSITNENGLTFHYSIPVYNKQEAFLAKEGANTFKKTDNNWYATTWLITGITGPDFVDRGTIGIIDKEDWGYWVKFDYGQFSTDYHWRRPYWGFESGESCKIGKKETYYLNNISTRSHTAICFKSYRTDGKSYYESDGVYNMCNYSVVGPANSHKPSSSLKLDDIYVLENSDYEMLTKTTSSGGLGLNLTNNSTFNNELQNGDTYDNVWDYHDISAMGNSIAIHQFLDANQIQRIHFNYDDRLCNKTYNSFDFDVSGNPPTYDAVTTPGNMNLLKGKLTLSSIELRGKNDQRIMPDYVFKYGNENYYGQSDGDNPNYNPIKYDGYGMYKRGQSSLQCQTGHNSEKKGDQWCLTEILTPMGSKVIVEYERDTYSEVNGLPVNPHSPLRVRWTTEQIGSTSGSAPYPRDHVKICEDNFGTNANLLDYFNIGDHFSVWDGVSSYVASGSGYVTNVANNAVFLNNSGWSGNAAEARIITNQKYGGNVRVKNIKIRDDNTLYSTHYIYTKDGQDNGLSSGVASYEPADDRAAAHADFSFYKQYDHPFGPILYSNVTVVTGKPGDATYTENQKQVYHFVTPKNTMLSTSKDMVLGDYECHIQYLMPNFSNIHWSSGWGTFNTIVNTASIGNLDTIKLYNQFNNLESKTVFEYTDNANSKDYANNMGTYTENNLLWEIIEEDPGGNTWVGYKMKMMQSYKLKRPSILKSITTYKDRLVSKKEIVTYDYITGNALVTKSTYGDFEKYEEEVVPAYTKYPALGSKIFDPKNKNILSANAETYAYVYDKNNAKKLLGASVSTWANNSNYRDYNSTSGYQNQQYTNNTAPYQTTWLPFQSYSWKSLIEENGTLKSGVTDVEKFVDFNWNSTPDNHWKKTTEISLYDHYSRPIESKDINNKFSSVKFGYNNSYLVGGCANAKYTAWCFSGAEDLSTDGNYFYGEVKGGNTQFSSPTYAHSGKYCSAISSGQKGFVFEIPTNDIPVTSKYRAYVWVHKTSLNNTRLYCRYITGSYIGITTNATTPSSIEQAGDWYLFSLDVDMFYAFPNNTFEFGVENIGSSTIYTDDFKVYPINSPVVSNVYDQKSGKLIATLNQDNYATKYYYDDAGRLISVYKESKNGFTKVMEKNYHYARQ